jgi:ParB family chromosome partitioning protein
MRLLKLPAQIQMALKNKDIDMGHARSLLAIESPSQQLKLFKEIQRNNYSVRKVEELVQLIKNGDNMQQAKKSVSEKALPLEFSILKDRLSELFQVKVQMSCSPQGKGKICIPFNSEYELEQVMNILDKIKN